MAGITTTTLSGALKTVYAKGIGKVMYAESPLAGMIPKLEAFYGDGVKVPVQYSGNAASSATFSSAQTGAGTSSNRYAGFTLTRKKMYALGRIDREALWATKSDTGAFIRELKASTDGSLYSIGKKFALGLYGNGGGALGQVSSSATVASTTLLLTNPNSVIGFERDMIIKTSTADGTSGSLNSGSVTLTGVTRGMDSSALLAGANFSAGISSIATNDYIFQDGDFGAWITGLAGWVPSSAPGATSFFGIDRTADTRLGGLRLTGTGYPIDELVQRMATLVYREGGRLSHFFMHPIKFHDLCLALQSKGVTKVEGKSSDATVGYSGIQVATPSGFVEVYADPYCPSDRIYGLKLDTWCFYSLGKVPHFVEDDGKDILRMTDEDSFEWRIVYMGNLGCNAPSHNIVATVSAT